MWLFRCNIETIGQLAVLFFFLLLISGRLKRVGPFYIHSPVAKEFSSLIFSTAQWSLVSGLNNGSINLRLERRRLESRLATPAICMATNFFTLATLTRLLRKEV